MDKKHALVIGAISIPHANLVKHGYDITWLLEKSGRRHISEVESQRCSSVLHYDPALGDEFILEMVKHLNMQKKIDAVLAFHDDAQVLASRVAGVLKLPFVLNQHAIENTHDKVAMRHILQSNQVASVPFSLVNTPQELVEFVSQGAMAKYIAKPIEGTGSEGIYQLEADKIMQPQQQALIAQMVYPVIVEGFAEGREFSVEAVTYQNQHHIIAITEKFKHPGTFMESGHLVPARLSDAETAQIKDYIALCLSTLGVNYGLSHSEVILTDQGPILIETHTRGGGDRIADLVRLHTGVDLFEVTTKLGLGMELEAAELSVKENGPHACIRFYVQDAESEVITGITGDSEAKALAGVEDIQLTFGVGQKLPQVKHSFDRAGSALVIGDTAEQAINTAQQAIDLIQFETSSAQ